MDLERWISKLYIELLTGANISDTKAYFCVLQECS